MFVFVKLWFVLYLLNGIIENYEDNQEGLKMCYIQ